MMNFILLPSLKHTALVKIATVLWSQDDIVALLSGIDYRLINYYPENEWQKIENKVKEKVLELSSLPGPIREAILSFIKPIGLQIYRWKNICIIRQSFHMDYVKELCWTPQGTINKKKTVETFIKNENFDINMRYKLACFFCLHDVIPELWARLPRHIKESFYNLGDVSMFEHGVLVDIWTYDMKGELPRIDNMIRTHLHDGCSAYQFAFESAALMGNTAATQYFFQKLTPMEREQSLVNCAKSVTYTEGFNINLPFLLTYTKNTDALLFLFSQMNEQQQINFFKIDPRTVLMHFFDWPWQQLFMKVVNNIWYLLSKQDCYYFLEVVANMVIKGDKINDYITIFSEFWQKSIKTYKNYVIDECSSGYLLSKLIEVENQEDISLILKYATLVKKEKYISNETVSEDLANSNKWKFLKYFIRNCIPSEEEMVQFKGQDHCVSTKKCISCKLIGILDEIIQENNINRICDTDYCSPAKRV